jgi:hypothetical protein
MTRFPNVAKDYPTQCLQFEQVLRYFGHDTMGCFTSPMQLSPAVKQGNSSAAGLKSHYNIV